MGEVRGDVHAGFLCGNLREGDHLDNADLDGRKILKWIFEKLDGGMDWLSLA
jgi:hypothetical protein